MKSIPAASAMRTSRRQSVQLADQRSGTVVAERPDEQLAPNRPILSWLPLYIARRFGNEASRADNVVSTTLRLSLRGAPISGLPEIGIKYAQVGHARLACATKQSPPF